MQWLYGVGVVVLLTVGLVYVTGNQRFAKTIFLIARVAPYEQMGTGAGKIQVLGDSTGYGTGASAGRYSVAGRLGADFPHYTITNQSVNGLTIGELLQNTADFTGQYDLILLQIGGNDILQKRETATVVAELTQLIARLQPHTTEIVMMSSGNVGAAVAFSGSEAATYEALTRAFRTAVIELAAATPRFTYVDLFDEPGNDPFQTAPDVYTAWDDLHPSNAGYGLWYQKAQPTLAAILTR